MVDMECPICKLEMREERKAVFVCENDDCSVFRLMLSQKG